MMSVRIRMMKKKKMRRRKKMKMTRKMMMRKGRIKLMITTIINAICGKDELKGVFPSLGNILYVRTNQGLFYTKLQIMLKVIMIFSGEVCMYSLVLIMKCILGFIAGVVAS